MNRRAIRLRGPLIKDNPGSEPVLLFEPWVHPIIQPIQVAPEEQQLSYHFYTTFYFASDNTASPTARLQHSTTNVSHGWW